MKLAEKLDRIAARLGLLQGADRRSAAGLVAAVVGIDSSRESDNWLSSEQEQQILAALVHAVERRADGKFDGAERNSTQVIWYFFGSDVRVLEDTLLPALRREPRCKGGVLRLTNNGVVGPWREVTI